MKRLFYCSVLAVTMSFITSCAQHDPNSPDTSGAIPADQPGVGVDTNNTRNTTTTPNMSNDHSNNNQQVNTGDTMNNRQ